MAAAQAQKAADDILNRKGGVEDVVNQRITQPYIPPIEELLSITN
jgi:hypothetical protein